jgi:DNA-binding NarL/FixJ family response regulator
MKYDTEARAEGRAMRAEMIFTAIQMDAMRDAFDIDPRLPRIIYMRRAGHTIKHIGKEFGITRQAVAKIVRRLPRKLFTLCGLR